MLRLSVSERETVREGGKQLVEAFVVRVAPERLCRHPAPATIRSCAITNSNTKLPRL